MSSLNRILPSSKSISFVVEEQKGKLSKDDDNPTDRKVQSLWTKHERDLLPLAECKELQKIIKDPTQLENLPRAEKGKIPVFLLEKYVLKKTPKSLMRLERIQKARSLCEEKKLSKLQIPKSRAENGFLMQRRLPLREISIPAQIALYVENQQLFAQAIQEITIFFCHARLTKVIWFGCFSYDGSVHALLRIDNVHLLPDGTIALVDLERMSLHPSRKEKDFVGIAGDLIIAFPHHFDLILKTIKEEGEGELESSITMLKDFQSKALEGFQKIYGAHKKFLEGKNISIGEATHFPKFTKKEKEKLRDDIEKKLSLINGEYEAIKGFFGKEERKEFQKSVFPKMSEEIFTFLEDQLKRQSKKFSSYGGSLLPSELTAVRTLSFSGIYHEYDKLVSHFVLSPFLAKAGHAYRSYVINECKIAFFQSLAEQKIIFSFLNRYNNIMIFL